jgi:hypothetical protein
LRLSAAVFWWWISLGLYCCCMSKDNNAFICVLRLFECMDVKSINSDTQSSKQKTIAETMAYYKPVGGILSPCG